MVYYLSEKQGSFSSVYLGVREKEHRLYSDEETFLLPYIRESHPYYREWNLRMKSTTRFLKYLSQLDVKEILEIGCGNGWFSYRMAGMSNAMVTGLDINEQELEQADRVFKADNLKFVYAHLFGEVLPEKYFDLIVLNGSVQYFPDFQKLMERLFSLLKKDGEVHIMDSPFYPARKTAQAHERSREYYRSLGFESMADHYFHHSLEHIRDFKVLYKPGILDKVLPINDSPFLWVKTVKP